MITNIRNIKTFTPAELSNDDYHSDQYDDFVSGSNLHLLYTECPAALKYGEHEATAALHFGTASHAAMLEPVEFDKYFIKALNKDDFDIKNDADIKAKMKKMGIVGYSTKKYPDLIMMLLELVPDVKIFSLESWIQEAECKANGITLVKNAPVKSPNGTERPGDYDMIMQMRNTLFANPDNVDLFAGAQVEMSFMCEIEIDGKWHKVKIRPDVITASGLVPDYKTTAFMQPEKFAKQAHDAGYWFKQAFICDILTAIFGKEHRAALLCQGKKSPHIYQLYNLTEEQLQIGREQYEFALHQHKLCNDTDNWPAYFDGPVDLPTPAWLAKQYDFS